MPNVWQSCSCGNSRIVSNNGFEFIEQRTRGSAVLTTTAEPFEMVPRDCRPSITREIDAFISTWPARLSVFA